MILIGKLIKFLIFSVIVLTLSQFPINGKKIALHFSDQFEQMMAGKSGDNIRDKFRKVRDQIQTKASALNRNAQDKITPEDKKKFNELLEKMEN